MSVAIGSGRGSLNLFPSYSGARLVSYTHRTLPHDTKEAILEKFRQGWFEPRPRPGQRVFEKECTPWVPYRDILVDEVRHTLDGPCDVVVARAGGGDIAGLLVWGEEEDACKIYWLVSDIPGLGGVLVNHVIRHAQAQADRTQGDVDVLVVSPGYKLAANTHECNDVPEFSLDWYWIRQGFQLDDRLGGCDFYRVVHPRS